MVDTLQHSTEFHCTCQEPSDQTSLSSGLRQSLGTLAATVSHWHSKSRQRQALAELDSQQLDDIGVSRSAADREARKPFWS
jgi:uncharacterized protein YjiS (DUF1127 family)